MKISFAKDRNLCCKITLTQQKIMNLSKLKKMENIISPLSPLQSFKVPPPPKKKKKKEKENKITF